MWPAGASLPPTASVERMQNGPAVETIALRKSYGGVHALRGVDLHVEPGSVFGLLGPNGAGKTTAVRILTTLLLPDDGSASVAGFDVVRDAAKVREHIGLAGQYAAVDENLTGFENLEMVGKLYHLPRGQPAARARELLSSFDLSDAADRLVRTYSGGMRRRLDLAAALVARPPGLFLDETTPRRCSSSTSRPPASTSAAASSSGRRSRRSSRGARRCCSPRRSSTRPTG